MENSAKTITTSSSTGKVFSNGLDAQGALPSHTFQTATLEEEKKPKERIARSNRQITSSVDARITSPPSKPIRSRRTNHAQSSTEINNNDQEHHHPIYTHDNVKLIYVLEKVLTSSDVNRQGRIVLPKREVEENFPRLDSKEGTLFMMKEVLSDTEWLLTYRFWANHKGRIYVLHNCGEFVRRNKLEAGDKLTFYQDIFKNVYFTITKKERHIVPPALNEREREEECEVDELTTSHGDDSYSTNRREDMPVFIKFL